MADETEEKTKQTVPGMPRTFAGIAANAEQVRKRWWDAERNVFTHPYMPTLALFAYAAMTANLLHEAEERMAKERTALDKRIAEFETRLTTLERWKAEAEAQTAVMVQGVEEMLASGQLPAELVKQFSTLAPVPAPVEEVLPAPTAIVDGTVTALKQPKKKIADDNKNGGAA